MVKKSAKVPIVEGFKFRVQQVNIERDYYHGAYDLADILGPSTIRVEMEASSLDYTKEDWGELMSALTAGEGATVVVKNG